MNQHHDTDDQERIAAYITECSAALESQSAAAGGWPSPLILPEPETPAENDALGLFLAELRQATGAEVSFRFRTRPH